MIRFAENLNKMIAAGLGGATEAPRTEVAVGHRIRYLESSGAVASFETNIVAPIRSLRVNMHPIQEGSGDPSPDNIRPITGRDSVTVERTGINVWDEEWEVGGISSSTGLPTTATDRIRSKNFIPVTAETAYYAHIGGLTTNDFLPYFYASDQSFLSLGIWMQSAVFTTPANAKYAKFVRIGDNIYGNNISINSPSTDHDYHAYDGQSVSIQLGQTVYGGTLDVSTGKLTVTHREIASYNGEALPGEWISDRDVYAAGTTPTIGAQVVYVLDTPQTIDLDPQQITTLKGTNNVWSNSGDVTLKYPYYEETEGY